MKTYPNPFEALTVPGELNAIPWGDIAGKGEFSRQLGRALIEDELPFQDTVPSPDLPKLAARNALREFTYP